MRELRAALGEGARATLHSAAHFPRRHPFAISGICLALVLILLGAGVYDTREQVSVQKKQITKIVTAAAICNKTAIKHPKRSAECAERLRVVLFNCRQHPSCRRAFNLAGVPPPKPEKGSSALSEAEGGGSQSPGKSPSGQQHGGGSPNTQQPGHQPGQKNPPKSNPPVEPAPETGSPPANPGGGNGGGQGQGEGQGQAQGQGVEVELCVQNPLLPACVNAGLSGLE